MGGALAQCHHTQDLQDNMALHVQGIWTCNLSAWPPAAAVGCVVHTRPRQPGTTTMQRSALLAMTSRMTKVTMVSAACYSPRLVIIVTGQVMLLTTGPQSCVLFASDQHMRPVMLAHDAGMLLTFSLFDDRSKAASWFLRLMLDAGAGSTEPHAAGSVPVNRLPLSCSMRGPAGAQEAHAAGSMPLSWFL